MKGIGDGFQIIYEFVTHFFIHSKITLFEGQNLGRICPLLIELLDQFPIGQIDLFLFLNTIERLAKSRVSKDI